VEGALILHASCGGGHRAAARALARALTLAAPDFPVEVEDALDHVPAAFRAAYVGGFEGVVRRAPRLYGAMFRATRNLDRRSWFRALRRFWNGLNEGRLVALLRDRKPRAVICTHFLPLEIATRVQRGTTFEGHVYSVVTDHVAHGLWRQEGAALNFCATGRSAFDLEQGGIARERILPTGIPIDPTWGLEYDVLEARRRAGLPLDRPVILLLAGGTGLGPLTEVLRATAQRAGSKGPAIVAVCGRNERLRVEAERATSGTEALVRVLGFVDPIVDLVRACSVVVTKPGALTTNECLAAGKALVFYEAAPGQETENARFAVERGAALDGRTAASAAEQACALVRDEPRRRFLERRALAIARPAAALDVASSVLAHVAGLTVGRAVGPARVRPLRRASARIARIA